MREAFDKYCTENRHVEKKGKLKATSFRKPLGRSGGTVTELTTKNGDKKKIALFV